MKRIQRQSKKTKDATFYLSFAVCFLLLFLTFSSGCGNKFFDPTQTGRFRPVPAVNVILDSLGVAEETPVAWDEADEPKPIDTLVVESDYVLMGGDVVRISIFELLQEGIEFINDYVVTETGKISIPDVGVVQAAGLTETQLEEEIRQILSPSILKEPSVVAILMRSQQRTFSILGDGIPGPGRYAIPRYGFKLADALAMAGGPRQFNVSYIYVSRAPGRPGETPSLSEPGLDLKLIEPGARESEMLEIIAPRAQGQRRDGSGVVISSSEMATSRDLTMTGLDAPASVDEPISVKDILRTLADRSRQDEVNEGNTEVLRVSSGPAVSRTGSLRPAVREAEADAIVNEFSYRPAPVFGGQAAERVRAPSTSISEPVGVGPEKVSVDDLLKTLSEPMGPEKAEPRADLDRVLDSLNEPQGRSRADEVVGIEQRLRAVTEPSPVQKTLEQIGVQDVKKPGLSIPVQPRLEPVTEDAGGRIEWVFQDGKWVPVQIGGPVVKKPVIKVEPGERVAPVEGGVEPVSDWDEGPKGRLIRIPADKLLAGDPRYNIVIKPQDTIHVPVDVIGEFCIMGNVNNQGYINLTGRPMTLKMAIAAAGGLGPLAWPKRCEVVRRIGKKKEEVVMVDLDKIASGEQPDFFIKPNDMVNVGTHATARWRAILRNAFRATYGFGFVYDRNFADRDFGNSPWPF